MVMIGVDQHILGGHIKYLVVVESGLIISTIGPSEVQSDVTRSRDLGTVAKDDVMIKYDVTRSGDIATAANENNPGL